MPIDLDDLDLGTFKIHDDLDLDGPFTLEEAVSNEMLLYPHRTTSSFVIYIGDIDEDLHEFVDWAAPLVAAKIRAEGTVFENADDLTAAIQSVDLAQFAEADPENSPMLVPDWNPLVSGPQVEPTVIGPLLEAAGHYEQEAKLVDYINKLQARVLHLEGELRATIGTVGEAASAILTHAG